MSDGDTRRWLGHALRLTHANAVDAALQLLVPVLLARLIDAQEFGAYRLLWLSANTVLALAPLGLPRGLFLFVPLGGSAAAIHVRQTVWLMTAAGLLAALCLLPGSP